MKVSAYYPISPHENDLAFEIKNVISVSTSKDCLVIRIKTEYGQRIETYNLIDLPCGTIIEVNYREE